jgi:dTDP-4-amino-4,6-dideoxygalactose transaminase
VKVPFVDLRAQYQTIKPEIDAAIAGVVADTAFIGGKYVDAFEKKYAEFCGCGYAVGVSSGTSALHLALVGLGIGPGDEVITAANTFIATTEAVSHAGATFRLVDINPATFNIDVSAAEAAITPRTKAIIPVHLYGQTAEMDGINDLARRRGLAVIEDACQAQGAEYRGRRAGSLGRAGAFSFYPAKNLGAYGDAGIVTTDDKDLAERIRLYANHGRRGATDHSVEGFNARLDGIQAAVLSAKLPHLPKWNHLYVIRVKERDRVKRELEAKGVYCGLHYPIPLHLLDAYKRIDKPLGSYPVTEAAAAEILSLPMFAEITGEQQQYVADCIKEIVRKA